MSKQATPRPVASDEALAVGRSIRVSPRKLNLVAQFIRGMSAKDALVQLTFLKKRVALDVKKVVQSAIANAENNHSLDVDRLYVKEAIVGKALVMTFQVQNFMTVPSSLLDTDIIAALPKSLAISLAERIPLQILEAPIRLPRINYSAYWHERNQNDAGHKWLRQTVLESAQEIKRSE
jgi:large subunit ribosomal protein L22